MLYKIKSTYSVTQFPSHPQSRKRRAHTITSTSSCPGWPLSPPRQFLLSCLALSFITGSVRNYDHLCLIHHMTARDSIYFLAASHNLSTVLRASITSFIWLKSQVFMAGAGPLLDHSSLPTSLWALLCNLHAMFPSPILTIQVICRIKGMKHLFTPLRKSILGFIYSLKELQQLFFFFYFLILPVRHTYRFTKAKQ